MSTKIHEDDENDDEEEDEDDFQDENEEDDDDEDDDEDEDEDEAEEDEENGNEGTTEKLSDVAGEQLSGTKRDISDNNIKSTAKKVKKVKDDDDNPKIVTEDYSAMDPSNIVPRSKRAAALRSGLAVVNPTHSRAVKCSTSTGINDDEDDEEAEF